MNAVNPRTIYQVKMTRIIDHTPEIRELLLSPTEPQEFRFKAGQFVMLHVPPKTVPETGLAKPILRAYSIASAEQDHKSFRLIFKHVPGGAASEFVWSLKGDETLKFTGPFGKLFFPEPPTPQLVFLNTGSGISQHLCYIFSKMEQYPNLKYRLLFGVRTEKDIYYQETLEKLKKSLPDFDYNFVLSRAAESWTGKKGYIQHHLDDFEHKKIETTFFLCGNSGMIKEAKAKLIEQDGIPASRILAEAFD